jgi:hypothetical protein
VQYCLPAAAVAFDWTKLLILLWALGVGVVLHCPTRWRGATRSHRHSLQWPQMRAFLAGLLESGLLGFWRLRIVIPRYYLALAYLITA